jgi:secondary thiamine-phosphate synthase enzyme
MVFRRELTIATKGRGTSDITRQVARIVEESGVRAGLANLWIHHTSASLIICENADPSVRADLETWFAKAIPDGDRMFTHDAEGDDDMPAHVRTVLTQTSIAIPVVGAKLALGTWQGIYLWEHRTSPHSRRLLITILGE